MHIIIRWVLNIKYSEFIKICIQTLVFLRRLKFVDSICISSSGSLSNIWRFFHCRAQVSTLSRSLFSFHALIFNVVVVLPFNISHCLLCFIFFFFVFYDPTFFFSPVEWKSEKKNLGLSLLSNLLLAAWYLVLTRLCSIYILTFNETYFCQARGRAK